MPPIVSVITPCYGHAQYLPETIGSVIAQTFTDWELIAIDDASPDNTGEIVLQYTDPRIRYYRQANAGMAGARNTGLQMAQGEFVVFLDDDDLLEPEFMQTGLEILRADPSLAGVYAMNYYVDSQSQIMPMVGGQVVPRAQFRQRLLEGGFFPPVAALTQLAIVREVGFFDATLEGEADRDLWLRISEKYQMQAIPRPLVRYRMHPGGRSNDMYHMFGDCLKVLDKHFGPPTGPALSWSRDKQLAYGFAYRYAAFGFMQQRKFDEAWQYMDQAIATWPALLERLDTFYELICGDQTKGYRGKADLLDVAATATTMYAWLDRIFTHPIETVRARRPAAYGHAHLATAMLHDQAGNWPAARRELNQAIRQNPRLLGSAGVMRRWLKLHLGQRAVAVLRPQEKDHAVARH